MILKLDFSSEMPIYMQIRNQVVLGIAEKKLMPGEKLPTIRALAEEAGINMMTVNKAYQILKQEGFITTDRRRGAIINDIKQTQITDKMKQEMKLIVSEAISKGVNKTEFLEFCKELYDEMEENL